MKLYLTGNPCYQQRHCYYVQGSSASFIVDCGYQRSYDGDELPHLTGEQIRSARYLFLTHSHENQAGGLLHLLSSGFTGRVVMSAETAQQLSVTVDDPIILEGLCLPLSETELPGGIHLIWGRSGHCLGSAWFRIRDDKKSILFSGDYYPAARIHETDAICGIHADVAVLDCDYGTQSASTREEQLGALVSAVKEAIDDGRPVLLPVPTYGRGLGVISCIKERLPEVDVFADEPLLRELAQLDATAMWVKPEASEILADVFVRPIPEEFVALGVYFISDPQLDRQSSLSLLHQLLICGARVFMTGTVEPGTYAASLMHSGHARMLRYAIHCTQEEMLSIAAKNHFQKIIAYRSDYAPTQSEYEI
ncbi:MAG: MBL fold metallo-hydrolase [Clostridia bacterium]|nr:MBL fold metallo-hydrolase [Clostridia bacterium]